MGKRVSKSFVFEGKRYYVKGNTQAEADRKIGEKIAELKQGSIRESNTTFDAWFNEYMDAYKSRIAEKTQKEYARIYKHQLKPVFGKMKLKDIRQIDCRKYLNGLDGYSHAYIHKLYILLNGALTAAVDNEMIKRNPMRGLKMPDGSKGHRRALTIQERDLFLKACGNCGKAGYFGKIVYYCGLRPSEVSRVRGEDFDPVNRTLRVRGTKTKNANRLVPVPKPLPYPDKEGLLFVSSRGNSYDKNLQYRCWLMIVKEMERISGKTKPDDLKFYCVRHDFGTRCIEAGIDLETVSKMMGHSSVAITSRVYLHSTETTLKNALDKMDMIYQ